MKEARRGGTNRHTVAAPAAKRKDVGLLKSAKLRRLFICLDNQDEFIDAGTGISPFDMRSAPDKGKSATNASFTKDFCWGTTSNVPRSNKPYGVYGITFNAPHATTAKPELVKKFEQAILIMSGARFVFFRDSVSLSEAQKRGCTCPVMGFGQDGAFAADLRDDDRAIAFLQAHKLEEGRFLCCIPRLRYTPYWTIPDRKTPMDETKHARNEAMKAHDLAPLFQAIVEVVRQTPMKVLICPEDETQMTLGKEMLFDQLPDDVKSKVVWRPDFWLTGEALSTYVRSAGLFGAEMHSPILCIGNGIPAIVCRWEEQTSKGIMWRDIGLGEWLFNLDEESEIPGIVPAVLALAKDPAVAKAKALQAKTFVTHRQRDTMQLLATSL
jgi:hypothetical protein